MKSISYLGLIVSFIAIFSGLPPFWENLILFVVGITIFVKSYLIYKAKEKKEEKTSFKQNNNFLEKTKNKKIEIEDELENKEFSEEE
jgi:prepilin signal peptidase PulO-like enzyme (type II secretory pathway)